MVNSSNVNFKASLVSKTTVLKRTENSFKTIPQEASFIKLSLNNSYDRKALKDIKQSWQHPFVESMYFDFVDFLKHIEEGNIFALTIQDKGFKNVAPEKVLGLVEVLSNGKTGQGIFLDYILKAPKNIQAKMGDFCKIGETMLNNLKNVYKGEIIRLFSLSDDSIKEFYRRNGFKQLGIGSNLFIYKPTSK